MKSIIGIEYKEGLMLDMHLPESESFDLFVYFHGGGLCSFIQEKHNAFCDARGACTNCVIEWLKRPAEEDA